MAPAPSSTEPDFYALLSLPSPSSSESEIRRAYRKTSLLYHPDKVTPTPETLEKFQLLQRALAVLTDPDEKAKYDQTREARLRRKEEEERLEGRRRKMKEELESRERGVDGAGAARADGSAATWGGAKRTWSERELEINRIKEENRRRREAVTAERQRKANEEREAQERREGDATQEKQQQQQAEQEENPEASQRSVKVRWLKEGDGVDIDADWIRRACDELCGPVEDVIVLKDRRKRIDGREKKSVLGTALVVFTKLAAAQKAVSSGVHGSLESVEPAAAAKEEDRVP